MGVEFGNGGTMIDLLQERLRQYHTSHERYAYLREYLQELILKIIEKSAAMAQLAFVGGTALRILYKLKKMRWYLITKFSSSGS